MPIYESKGFGNDLNLFDKKAPFDYIAEFRVFGVPKGIDLEEYKRTRAPYCISGKVIPDKNGSYKRNNSSLIYRDLIFLDYDDIQITSEPVKHNATSLPYTPRPSGQKSMTMRIIDTLFHGFGDEGGRNVAVTRFVGLLLSKWVDADVATAYELTTIANSVTDNPLPEQELERTFESIVKSEIRKRGVNGN